MHFAYGLLLTYPVRQVVVRVTGLRGFWGYFLPMDLTMSSSASYELIEWGAAVVFGGDLGIAYVGAQGDPWDAQKDMSLAALGAMLATAAIVLTHCGAAAEARSVARVSVRADRIQHDPVSVARRVSRVLGRPGPGAPRSAELGALEHPAR